SGFFILPHETTVTSHIRAEDRRQLAFHADCGRLLRHRCSLWRAIIPHRPCPCQSFALGGKEGEDTAMRWRNRGDGMAAGETVEAVGAGAATEQEGEGSHCASRASSTSSNLSGLSQKILSKSDDAGMLCSPGRRADAKPTQSHHIDQSATRRMRKVCDPGQKE